MSFGNTKSQMWRLESILELIRDGIAPKDALEAEYGHGLSNCSTIAGQLEISKRTVQRDIDYLRDMLRAPIDYDASRKGYYLTDEAYHLPAGILTGAEWEALCQIEAMAPVSLSHDSAAALTGIMSKLAATLDSPAAEERHRILAQKKVAPPQLGTEARKVA
ncbi:MAG: HTH domain-containing protein [Lysobacterales bacterium]|nr:MAG: HTH domain-containing protein [Xanthomonadales bacterium]